MDIEKIINSLQETTKPELPIHSNCRRKYAEVFSAEAGASKDFKIENDIASFKIYNKAGIRVPDCRKAGPMP